MVGSASKPRGGALLAATPAGLGESPSTDAGGTVDCASRWPHVTQNRKLRGFRLPQSGHAGASCPDGCPEPSTPPSGTWPPKST
jgi:hypothetical protein